MDVIVFNASTNQNGMGSSWRHITSFFSFFFVVGESNTKEGAQLCSFSS